MHAAGLFLVLVDEPGKDLRALPGFFHDPAVAVNEHVSFQEHPQASRFLLVQVYGMVGPVQAVEALGGVEQEMARARAALPPTPLGAAG